MNRKIVIAAIGVIMVFLVVTYATASFSVNTPLYRYRMEQSSSKMNFLPTALSTFAYTAEKGYQVKCDVLGSVGDDGDGTDSVVITCQTTGYTCLPTCESSCPDTCWPTCPDTCWYTCDYTCDITCSTCDVTCFPGCLTAVTETC
ncbi:MAG: hypothetical protein HXS44_07650 [Theionarchaea archaeon]|nr:hypothetical protein [Theionarchaea archaeon]